MNPRQYHEAAEREAVARSARVLLRNLQIASQSVEACALVSYDGLVIASVLGQHVDVDRFGAMCATLLALAGRAAREIGNGTLRQIILDGSAGPVLLTRAGATGVLAVAADAQVHLGKLILDTRNTAQGLAQLTPS